MSHSTTTRPGAPERQFVFGPERLRATILTTATETDGRHDLTDGVLPPGATVPLHLHTRYQERLFVVSGSLTVWAGPDTLTLRPGDFYHVPMHVPHTFRAGSEGARALNISSPAGFAETITRAGTPAHLATPDTEFDLDLLMAVAAELGDVVLGPPGTTPADLANSQDTERSHAERPDPPAVAASRFERRPGSAPNLNGTEARPGRSTEPSARRGRHRW